ncbi:hypothetical protein TrVE_jg5838 [Triparma verrucosa]|uniref:PA domain-containing protein n=1 Tax=Triparma verrucosa TaxID=1606542 RepID=A0A9W7F2G3_9STRA|nr:hypothetical protein TrVE_jg5838 [Triparma verrucosa]
MRAPDPKFLSLLFLAFVTLPPTSLSIDPESIIPPHVRHETSTLIKNNLSDPLLDYTYFPRKQLVHDNTILEPHFLTVQKQTQNNETNDNPNNNSVFASPLGYKIAKSNIMTQDELLVSVNIDRTTSVPIAPYDLTDVLTSPEKFAGEDGKGFAFPVLTDGKLSGFLHVSYTDQPFELVVRPTGQRRYDFNYEKMTKKAEEEAKEMERIKLEIERREKAEEEKRLRDDEKRREDEERERMKKVREEGERMKSEAAKREREATATAAAQNAAQNNAASEETNRARLQELENERQEKVRAAEQARLKKQQEEEEKKRLDAKQGEERRKEEEKIKAEKKARLDQHLYGLTKSAEEEAHFRSARASGDSFEFTLKFDPEVSLGLTFDLQQDGVIVESVVGQASKAGVESGDSIIAVCDGAVSDVRSAVKAIGKCDDRLIKFKSPQVASNDEGILNDDESVKIGGEEMVLKVTSPSNLAGNYDLTTSVWGKVKVQCQAGKEPAKIVISSSGIDDADLCIKSKAEHSYGTGTIVLARRGKCAMPDKVTNGKTSSFVIIVNTTPERMDIPSGGIGPMDVGVGSIGWDVGESLLSVLMAGGEITGTVECDGGAELIEEDKGTLQVGSGDHTVHWARFGSTEYPAAPVKVKKITKARGNSEFGCTLDDIQVKVAGAVAVVKRGGGCGFGDKVVNLEKAGAIGVIIVDTGGGDQRVMCSEEQAGEIGIFVGMVSSDYWASTREEEWAVIRP